MRVDERERGRDIHLRGAGVGCKRRKERFSSSVLFGSGKEFRLRRGRGSMCDISTHARRIKPGLAWTEFPSYDITSTPIHRGPCWQALDIHGLAWLGLALAWLIFALYFYSVICTAKPLSDLGIHIYSILTYVVVAGESKKKKKANWNLPCSLLCLYVSMWKSVGDGRRVGS